MSISGEGEPIGAQPGIPGQPVPPVEGIPALQPVDLAPVESAAHVVQAVPAEAVASASPVPAELARLGIELDDIELSDIDPASKRQMRFLVRIALAGYQLGVAETEARHARDSRHAQEDLLAAVVTGGGAAAMGASTEADRVVASEPEDTPAPEPEVIDKRTEREKIMDDLIAAPHNLWVSQHGRQGALGNVTGSRVFGAIKGEQVPDPGVSYDQIRKASKPTLLKGAAEVVGFGLEQAGQENGSPSYVSFGEFVGDEDVDNADQPVVMLEMAVIMDERTQSCMRFRAVAPYSLADMVSKQMGNATSAGPDRHPEFVREFLQRYLTQRLEGVDKDSEQHTRITSTIKMIEWVYENAQLTGDVFKISNVAPHLAQAVDKGREKLPANDASKKAFKVLPGTQA